MKQEKPNHRKVTQYVPFADGGPGNGNPGENLDHGTHVAGSVAGKARGGHYVSRAFSDIQQEMIKASEYLEPALFKEYWGYVQTLSSKRGTVSQKGLKKASKVI